MMIKRIFILEARSLLRRSIQSDNPTIANAARRILENEILFEEFVEKRFERYRARKRKLANS